jgi:hypothetical protein
MMFCVGQFLKLVSFHHVMSDNRVLIKKIDAMSAKQKKDTAALASHFNINEETFAMAIEYPNNLRIGHYIRYLAAPTFCYQHIYPLAEQIRPGNLAKRFFEFIGLAAFCSYLIS